MTKTYESGTRQIRIRPRPEQPWAVILAGGDGVRLRPLSRLISGDDRPKQFCPMFGDRSLLAHTRSRLAGMSAEDRTLFVVTRAHERFYSAELADVPARQVIVQPSNKGTGTAIACALHGIVQRDPDAVVAFFPSDHYYSDEALFQSAVESAVETAAAHQECLVLLGAEATCPETGYGWIEPGPVPAWHSGSRLHSVSRFWEKPSRDTAEVLQSRGCLWNTFVMVGHASTFFCLLESAVPGLLRAFSASQESGNLGGAYLEDVAPVDFSQQVLSRSTAQLFVVGMDASAGWSDLGEPQRVLATLARVGAEPWQTPLRNWLASGVPLSAGSVAAVA